MAYEDMKKAEVIDLLRSAEKKHREFVNNAKLEMDKREGLLNDKIRSLEIKINEKNIAIEGQHNRANTLEKMLRGVVGEFIDIGGDEW